MIEFAAVILVKKDGSVLAQLRDDIPDILEPNKWGVVGGGKENKIDDDLKATAIRELSEETNYLARSKDLNLLSFDVYQLDNGLKIERTIFWAKYDGKQQIACNEGQEIRFVNPTEFERLEFAKDNKKFVKEASQIALAADNNLDVD